MTAAKGPEQKFRIEPATGLAVDVRNATKIYRIWKNPRARLRHPFLNLVGQCFPFSKFGLRNPKHAARGLFHEFHALHDVTLGIKQGGSIGVIGRNGAGKSTLLQIIAGTMRPSSGKVGIKGRVAALLELGSGFNPEFTGRENVRLNAAILGITPEEIEARFEEIAAFADIGEFMEQPVKTYSSGMQLRLAFAVQIMLEPSLLIVDEALAVGDLFFVQKCFERLRRLREKGTTLLFVSHSMESIVDLCEEAVWLEQGRLRQQGPAKEVTKEYEKQYFQERNANLGGAGRKRPLADGAWESADARLEEQLAQRSERVQGLDGTCFDLGCGLFDANGDEMALAICDTKGSIAVRVVSDLVISDFHVGIHIKDRQGRQLFGTNSYGHSLFLGNAGPSRVLVIVFEVSLSLLPGEYVVWIGLSSDGFDDGDCHQIHFYEAMLPFSVAVNRDLPFFSGFCRLPASVRIFTKDSTDQKSKH